MKKNTIEPLVWDSQFFGYPVAQIALDSKGSDSLDQLFAQLKAQKIKLTYFFVPPVEKGMNEHIVEKGGIFVDQKTVFLKETQKHGEYSNLIGEFQGTEVNERLIELTLQSGIFSRFRIDKNFKKKEYERLYIEWITKSVKKEISFKTLVALKGNDIVGITTLDDEKNHANIGLVAVDESCRGRGIGRDLIHCADTIAFDSGFKKLKVVTQLQNKGACKLYEKCGFHIESITNVYHYWE
jgi:dTDP-4-amino-4,6-dideoxy-D-galactose acyltransferase